MKRIFGRKELQSSGQVTVDEDGDGREVQIVEIDRGSIRLNKKALERLLLDKRVKDKPVVVVSVVGAFRKGKSFLLNFFLRYLRNFGKDDWLGDPDNALRGFGWCGGRKRHTEGILAWSEVFLVKAHDGHEVAVLLMDTQGTFDCETTASVYTAIFALSAMVSSVLVYNVSQNIQEDDLLHLQLFAEYGLLAQQKNSNPFQKLLFLVRDWPYNSETPYGAEGGQEFLAERLVIAEHQGKDLQQLRERIRSSFSKIACYLMPYPGTKVATADKSFEGRLSDIDEEFKSHLLQLVPLVLAPSNLLVKEINGHKITCGDLMSYFAAYVQAFKGGQVPVPRSLLELTVQASNVAAKNKGRDLYTSKMLEVWKKPGADRSRLQDHHYRLLEEAEDLFCSNPKMGGEKYSDQYLELLTKEINDIYDKLAEIIGDKSITDSVAFKAVHGILIAGAAGATVGLVAVELPVIAAATGAVGAALLVGNVAISVHSYLQDKKRIMQGTEAIFSQNEDNDDNLTDMLPGKDTLSSGAEVQQVRFTDSQTTRSFSVKENEGP